MGVRNSFVDRPTAATTTKSRIDQCKPIKWGCRRVEGGGEEGCEKDEGLTSGRRGDRGKREKSEATG